jgi:hypothetical protein
VWIPPRNFCTTKAKEGEAGKRLSRYQSEQGDKYATFNSTRDALDDGPLCDDYCRRFVLYRTARTSGVLITVPLSNHKYRVFSKSIAQIWISAADANLCLRTF